MSVVLFVAATLHEVAFLQQYQWNKIDEHNYSFYIKNQEFNLLITGVGSVATSYHLTKALADKSIEMVLNIGIAGALNKSLQLGEVVNITFDRFADLGAEDDEQFLSLFDLKLADLNETPFTNGEIYFDEMIDSTTIQKLLKVKGITVNKVHGNEKSIETLKKYVDADVESMEGAACFYVCKMEHVPCIQLRAISNYVEKRNRDSWKIKEALQSLERVTLELLNEITINRL